MSKTPPSTSETSAAATKVNPWLVMTGQVFSTAVSLAVVTAMLPSRLQDVVYQGGAGHLSTMDASMIGIGFRIAIVVLILTTVGGMAASARRGKVDV
jgi:hypothetical protein